MEKKSKFLSFINYTTIWYNCLILNYNTYSRAKLLLRKKKYQEGLLEKTDGQLDNLETLVHDLEFAQVEKQVLKIIDTSPGYGIYVQIRGS